MAASRKSEKFDLAGLPPEVTEVLSMFDDGGNGVSIQDMQAAGEKWKASQGHRDGFALKAFPDDLQECLKAFDQDGDGTVGKSELATAAKMFSESKQQVQKMKKIIAALSAVMVIMLLCIMGLMFMVVDVSKENRTASDGVMTAKGDPSKAVRTDTVESFTTFLDTPALDLETLSYMKQVTFYVNMTGFMAEATFKVAGAYKPAGSKDIVFLETNQGYIIAIDRVGRNANITMGGKGTFNVYADLDSYGKGRRLHSAPLQDPVLLTKEGFAKHTNTHGRQLADRGGALMAAGSFEMTAEMAGYGPQLHTGFFWSDGDTVADEDEEEEEDGEHLDEEEEDTDDETSDEDGSDERG